MIQLSRRRLGVLATLGGLVATQGASATPVASPVSSPVASPEPGRHIPCAINYDVGSELARGEFTRPAEHERFYSGELTAIRDQLHATDVGLFGSRPEQLMPAMNIAAELGLGMRAQTRLNFIKPPEMLHRLKTVGEEAERLRSEGASIVLDVGCEYMLFADGVIDGDDFFEKLEVIESGNVDWQNVFTTLFGMLHTLAAEARTVFAGQIAYSDTPMDVEIWDPFDIIGIDHYLSEESASTYIQTIDDLAASGKPVWVTEFGSTANAGAPEGGGMGWDIVDYETNPPQIVDGVTRDEAAQKENILETLTLIGQSRAEKASLYEFITPAAPHMDIPEYDWDLTAYGVVLVRDEDHRQSYEDTGYWEPKEAFHALADWNMR